MAHRYHVIARGIYSHGFRCAFKNTRLQTRLQSTKVNELQSWDLESFREIAYDTKLPAVLPRSKNSLPSACQKWFIHDGQDQFDLMTTTPKKSCLKPNFWNDFSHIKVPLEITTTDSNSRVKSFEKIDAPLELLLEYLRISMQNGQPSHTTVYLAQHDLRDLPPTFMEHLPVPDLIKFTGKGDLYSSSLWMGCPPTYTPLHRDPNPNLFLQLAGTKIIRLFDPQIGEAMYEYAGEYVRESTTNAAMPKQANGRNIDGRLRSAAFRGEEMMIGQERIALERLVWDDTFPSHKTIQKHMYEAQVSIGQGLFIPQGWWHSVKSIGSGVTASANWWFR